MALERQRGRPRLPYWQLYVCYDEFLYGTGGLGLEIDVWVYESAQD